MPSVPCKENESARTSSQLKLFGLSKGRRRTRHQKPFSGGGGDQATSKKKRWAGVRGEGKVVDSLGLHMRKTRHGREEENAEVKKAAHKT